MNKVENNKINQKAPWEMKMLMVKPRKHRAIFCHFSPRYEPGKVQTLARCGQDVAPAHNGTLQPPALTSTSKSVDP